MIIIITAGSLPTLSEVWAVRCRWSISQFSIRNAINAKGQRNTLQLKHPASQPVMLTNRPSANGLNMYQSSLTVFVIFNQQLHLEVSVRSVSAEEYSSLHVCV